MKINLAGWTADGKIVGGWLTTILGLIVTLGPKVAPSLPAGDQAIAGTVILIAGSVATALGDLKKGS